VTPISTDFSAAEGGRFAIVLTALSGALILAMIASMAIGPFHIAFGDIAASFARRLAGAPRLDPIDTVVLDIRLPRVLGAALVGAVLAAAGAAYQALFRNPLVSPDILGVSTGAGLGAVIGILLSLPVVAIQIFGFIGGLVTVGCVMLLASALGNQNRLLVLVLCGIVVGALASAAISLVKVLADPYDQLPAITFWLLGSLASVRNSDLASVAPVALVGLVPLAMLRWQIGILSVGDDEARSLGVEAGRLRMLVIAAATLITASVVAISGVIGWIGLMVPHMGRFLVGPRFDRLLPVSLLLGAVFMVAVDMLARTIALIEVPIGILTAVVGAPVFVWLLALGRRSWAA
jgi:iron complex transport system permease protein